MPKSAQVRLWFSLKVLVLVSNCETFSTMKHLVRTWTWLTAFTGLRRLSSRLISRTIFQKYVGPCALSSEVGNGALIQMALSSFAKCNHGATATEMKFFWVLWSFLISSVIENLNPVSLQQTADLFPEHVPQRSFRLFFNAESSPEDINTSGLRLCRGVWHSKIWQKLLINGVSYINSVGVELCLGA